MEFWWYVRFPSPPTFHNTEPGIAVIKIYNTSGHHKKLGFAAPHVLQQV